MDISSFLGGNYLTHLDLPEPLQAWTIQQATQQMVGTDHKICITFAEFPSKPLGLNKTNLRRVAETYTTDANSWLGKKLQVYRTTTSFQGESRLCIRVCDVNGTPPEPTCDSQGHPVPLQASKSQPATTPANTAQPVSAPEPTPFDGFDISPPGT